MESTLNGTKYRNNLFVLPKEHGAIVTLVLSIVIATFCFGILNTSTILALSIFWLMVTTIHRDKVNLMIATSGGILMMLITGNVFLLSMYLMVWLGNRLMNKSRAQREVIGIVGASTAPFLIIWLASGCSSSHSLVLAIVLPFLCAALIASVVVHYAINQFNESFWIMISLTIPLLILINLTIPQAIFWLLIPVLIQFGFRDALSNLSFKNLGLLQTAYLTTIALVIIVLNTS